MTEELGASTRQLQWIVDSYLLVFTGLLLVAGGNNVFTNARERATAIGIWSAVTGVAVAAGPILGRWPEKAGIGSAVNDTTGELGGMLGVAIIGSVSARCTSARYETATFDADDIADEAVAALTQDGHRGEIYELTSPHLYTLTDVAAEPSRTTGRTISYVAVTVEEYAAGAVDHGVPPELVSFLTYLFGKIFGNNAYVTDGVQRSLGRSPRDFATFAEAAAAASAWELESAS